MVAGISIDRVRSYTSRGFVVLLWGALAVWLAGCGAPAEPEASAPAPRPAVAAVSASQATLAAAGRVVMACYAVPACAAVAPKAKIRSAYDAAYDAVVAAQAVADTGATPDMSATTAAMVVLRRLVTQLPPVKS